MHKTLRTIGAAGAMLCLSASIVAAQNNSDHNATSVGTAAVSGAYSPGSGATPPVTAGTIASEARVLANGSAAQQQVGAVLAGGSTAVLAAALTSGGAPAAQVNALMGALSNLASNPSPAALQATIAAYNALIAAAPAGFIANPPPQVQAIRGALIQIRAGR
jgi:hypothetical protein